MQRRGFMGLVVTTMVTMAAAFSAVGVWAWDSGRQRAWRRDPRGPNLRQFYRLVRTPFKALQPGDLVVMADGPLEDQPPLPVWQVTRGVQLGKDNLLGVEALPVTRPPRHA